MCHQRRLTQDVDVVFIEFAVNDPAGPHTSMERLIRKVLQYPNRCGTEDEGWLECGKATGWGRAGGGQGGRVGARGR